jgi:hypothetical protein
LIACQPLSSSPVTLFANLSPFSPANLTSRAPFLPHSNLLPYTLTSKIPVLTLSLRQINAQSPVLTRRCPRGGQNDPPMFSVYNFFSTKYFIERY